jgi:hypothetical protein
MGCFARFVMASSAKTAGFGVPSFVQSGEPSKFPRLFNRLQISQKRDERFALKSLTF